MIEELKNKFQQGADDLSASQGNEVNQLKYELRKCMQDLEQAEITIESQQLQIKELNF